MGGEEGRVEAAEAGGGGRQEVGRARESHGSSVGRLACLVGWQTGINPRRRGARDGVWIWERITRERGGGGGGGTMSSMTRCLLRHYLWSRFVFEFAWSSDLRIVWRFSNPVFFFPQKGGQSPPHMLLRLTYLC